MLNQGKSSGLKGLFASRCINCIFYVYVFKLQSITLPLHRQYRSQLVLYIGSNITFILHLRIFRGIELAGGEYEKIELSDYNLFINVHGIMLCLGIEQSSFGEK